MDINYIKNISSTNEIIMLIIPLVLMLYILYTIYLKIFDKTDYFKQIYNI